MLSEQSENRNLRCPKVRWEPFNKNFQWKPFNKPTEGSRTFNKILQWELFNKNLSMTINEKFPPRKLLPSVQVGLPVFKIGASRRRLAFTGTRRLAVCLVMKRARERIGSLFRLWMEHYVFGSLCELLDINSWYLCCSAQQLTWPKSCLWVKSTSSHNGLIIDWPTTSLGKWPVRRSQAA